MTALSKRKSRLTFETGDTIRDRGKLREIIIEAHERYAIIRLKGTRKTFTYTWAGLYCAAAKLEADELRRSKAAAKKAKA